MSGEAARWASLRPSEPAPVSLGLVVITATVLGVDALRSGQPPALNPAFYLLFGGTLGGILAAAGMAWWLLGPIESTYRRGGLAMVSGFATVLLMLICIPVHQLLGRSGLFGLLAVRGGAALLARRARRLGTEPMTRRLLVQDLGRRAYGEVLELQRTPLPPADCGELGEDLLLLVEHEPVVTLGRGTRAREPSLSRRQSYRAAVSRSSRSSGGETSPFTDRDSWSATRSSTCDSTGKTCTGISAGSRRA